MLERATQNNAFSGWKLRTACGGHSKDVWAKFLTLEPDGTQKFTEEYKSEPDRQVWNLTKAEEDVLSPEELGAKIFKPLSYFSSGLGL